MARMVDDEKQSEKEQHEALIPRLPDEIAELCLLHIPYPYNPLVRSVSSSWNKAITNPSFQFSKKTLSPPHLFVLSFHTQTAKIQWQALDPSTGRWFVLPSMPLPNDVVSPYSFSCASFQGKLFVMNRTLQTTYIYRTATNQWLRASDTMSDQSFFAAEEVNGRIVTVGRSGTEIYNPESDTWRRGKGITGELARYEAVVVGERMYVTEGWWWPFAFGPRGWVYEAKSDTWREMREGMRNGWTGVTVAVCERVFVIAEHGDLPVKVYDEETDTWRCVEGDSFPREVMRRPFTAKGLDGKIYVVSLGLNVAIGTVSVNSNGGGVRMTWRVLKAPQAFREFSPSSCQVLYA